MTVRKLKHEEESTEFGKWVRGNCLGSHELSVTNLDYVHDLYRDGKLMLVEEKTRHGELATGQRKTFHEIDRMLSNGAVGYNYWGFYLLQMPSELPEPGMKLNGQPVSEDELVAHLSFERRVVQPYQFRWRRGQHGLSLPDRMGAAVDWINNNCTPEQKESIIRQIKDDNRPGTSISKR